MIIREEKDHYLFITQHDHAYIAGEMFSNLRKEFVPDKHYESLKFAIHQHDRAWLVPDSHPLMDDLTGKPFSFLNYPEKLKLQFYKFGIEQVNLANSYAAILCSMHYCSLLKHSVTEEAKVFLDREKSRQKFLCNGLKLSQNEVEILDYQLKILNLCDNIALYVCMTSPETRKDQEHPMFVNGLDNSNFFNQYGYRGIVPTFIQGKLKVKFSYSPFENHFDVKIAFRSVPKDLIKEVGLATAYHDARSNYYALRIT
ncbi:DUF3891 family protein [Pedobacter sp. SD-b]|uniref:DUF3891 family protein n=1 Tax=Pedobacter segetis TaxID=2793069 RepID=A0ABS1BKB0_9SPHI|nr:DUF3891 family protein [Pedobacter segetis]MBK0383323.1 DUF3891 family protein [Pedobacter segetis]